MDIGSEDSKSLSFRISTGLKRVLGRELITNDEVAIFELVKNSFDAKARNVFIYFGENSIAVVDDGSGMSLDDIENKWLFVAYSAKRNHSPDETVADYRDEVADRRHYAGSKGVGRFSSDRLGKILTLQTRPFAEKEESVHRIVINWPEFDANDLEEFDTVKVDYNPATEFVLPKGIPPLTHGTAITIFDLQDDWTWDRLIRLKRGLAKLINPFGTSSDGFSISIIAPEMMDGDKVALEKHARSTTAHERDEPDVVNGPVGNFIFSTLQQKTTYISVSVDAEKNLIESVLVDRGELIYNITEPNPYPLLRYADFHCQLYFLNQSAKLTFARRMGLESVKFGSVFLFRNGFRVFPVGEDGDDWFQMDRRKAQGFARFLGTREVIGRMDVSGSDRDFQESSSRDQGLIETEAVGELRTCFREHCLKRLEKYVVPVNWALKTDKFTDTLEVIETDSGKAKVTAAVAGLIGSEDVTLKDFSHRLIQVLNERSEIFESSLAALKVISKRSRNPELAIEIEQAEERFRELKTQEAESRRIADEERKAKEEAEARARAAEATVTQIQEQLDAEIKRSSFLTSLATVDTDTLNSFHHQITIYSTNLKGEVEGLIQRLQRKMPIAPEVLMERLEAIAFANKQIHAIARFATKANFRLESEHIKVDLAEYVVSYVTEIASMFSEAGMTVTATTDGKIAIKRFKPIDVAIVIDNLLSNAKKARSSILEFQLSQTDRGVLVIRVKDNGAGIDHSVAKDQRLFEKGVSTTDGSGLGLFHVKQVLGDLGGTIDVAESSTNGATFLIRIPL